jgi:GDP-L-fucose synthase
MKILVTGATGFLGTHLCRELQARGHELTRLSSTDCDLTHSDSLDRFNQERFDRIFHLATWTQAGDFCLRHAGEQWLINQQINTNTLAWWKARQPEAKLICMGASCCYAPGDELVEENYLHGLPIDSLFSYAMTKRMLYVGLSALQKQFGLRYLCLVPATLYGPEFHMDGRQRHFIFDLIHKIVRGKLYGEPVVLWGDGHQKRELLFVEDFTRIVLQLVEIRDDDLINIGENVEFTIRQFAQCICEQVGFDFQAIQFDTTRYTGATSKCLRTDKLRQVMPDLMFTPLRVGLQRTIDWYRAHSADLVCRQSP